MVTDFSPEDRAETFTVGEVLDAAGPGREEKTIVAEALESLLDKREAASLSVDVVDVRGAHLHGISVGEYIDMTKPEGDS